MRSVGVRKVPQASTERPQGLSAPVLLLGADLYSPSCREGVFSETQLPVYRVLGN